MGKDITLHVSANNPATSLYHKFGFRIVKMIRNFYLKYHPADCSLSPHALLLKLDRYWANSGRFIAWNTYLPEIISTNTKLGWVVPVNVKKSQCYISVLENTGPPWHARNHGTLFTVGLRSLRLLDNKRSNIVTIFFVVLVMSPIAQWKLEEESWWL